MTVTPLDGDGLVLFHVTSESQRTCPKCHALYSGKRRTACIRCGIQLEPIKHQVDLSKGVDGECACQHWECAVGPKKPGAPKYCKHVTACREFLKECLVEVYLKQHREKTQ